MLSFILEFICNSTPKGDRTVTAPEMARTCGTGLEACWVVSRFGCHHSASDVHVLLTECSCSCAAGICGKAGVISASAGSVYGRSGGLEGAPARWAALQPLMHVHKEAWHTQLSSAAHCSKISSYTWSGRCRLFVWVNLSV